MNANASHLARISAALLAVASLFLTACGQHQSSESSAAPSKLVVASDVSFPPMEFVDDSGGFVGFDMDLIKAVAKEAGLEIQIENVAWDGLFGTLESKTADVIISSVTITDERKAKFDFTEPYMIAGQVVLVRAGDKAKYPNLEALKGKPVGVQMGTTGADRMTKEPVELKQYNTAGLAIIDLANGNLEAVMIDKPVADYFATQKPEFAKKVEIAGEPHTTEQFGIMIRKGDNELLKKLNGALTKLRQDGTIKRIEATWFR